MSFAGILIPFCLLRCRRFDLWYRIPSVTRLWQVASGTTWTALGCSSIRNDDIISSSADQRVGDIQDDKVSTNITRLSYYSGVIAGGSVLRKERCRWFSVISMSTLCSDTFIFRVSNYSGVVGEDSSHDIFADSSCGQQVDPLGIATFRKKFGCKF